MISKLKTYLYSPADARAQNLTALFLRFTFAAVLFLFFWNSALTKFDGFLHLSAGSYAQIFPKAFEAVGYNASKLGFWRILIAYIGAFAEVILPLMIVLGVFVRLSAPAMIGFIVIMTFADHYGHDVPWGQLFDGDPASIIADQRLLWVSVLFALTILGDGYLSVSRILRKFFG